jgi:UPF0755 protein
LRALLLAVGTGSVLTGCGGAGSGDPVRIVVPRGASFSQVTDSLAAHDIINMAPLFKLYGRAKGAAGSLKPGTYAFKRGTAWQRILDDMHDGKVLTARLVIPEAFDVFSLAPRIAQVTGLPADSVLGVLTSESAAARYHVPGPTLEGYLYPATYNFPISAPLDSVLRRLVATYERVWTPARRARADSMQLSEREVVTIASIVEREAKKLDEMPLMSAVYQNRLRFGMPLGADPTVQYALGAHRARISYAAIDSVADNPYNTYRNKGLPPGPIASPSARAIDAALYPADSDYLYFVARPDGSHVFTRSLKEHNREKLAIQRARANADSTPKTAPKAPTTAPPKAPPRTGPE